MAWPPFPCRPSDPAHPQLRICFAKEDATLDAAVERLRHIAADHVRHSSAESRPPLAQPRRQPRDFDTLLNAIPAHSCDASACDVHHRVHLAPSTLPMVLTPNSIGCWTGQTSLGAAWPADIVVLPEMFETVLVRSMDLKVPHYDKRHLFTLAGEHDHFKAG